MSETKVFPQDIDHIATDIVRTDYSKLDDDPDWLLYKAIGSAILAERPAMQPISTAPELDRIMVCGWSEPRGRTAGYWWWVEDGVHKGRACDNPTATHWFPIKLPVFPAGPKGGDE